MTMRSASVSIGLIVALMTGTVTVPAGAQSQVTTQGQAPASDEDSAGQDHIRSCDADATTKSIDGDARESFMHTCLSRKIGEGNLNAAQRKMESCTSEAAEHSLQGDARMNFINACLKPPAAEKPGASPAAS
jgi:psiF repeat